MSLESRIERLEALSAISDLIGALARAFDPRPSSEALLPLFTDQAEFVIDDYGTLQGGANIAAGVEANADLGFRWTLHYLISPQILLAPDLLEADVEFMLWELATAVSGRDYWIGGRYRGKVRTDGAKWRFHRLVLQAELASHYREGWHQKPASLQDV